MVGSLKVSQVLWRALWRPLKQSTILFQFSSRCVFGQPGKEKWWMWLSCLPTNLLKCGRIWRLIGTKMNSEVALKPNGGRVHEMMPVGWDIFDPWEWFAVAPGSVDGDDHTRIERLQINGAQEWNVYRHIQIQTKINWRECNCILKPKHKWICKVRQVVWLAKFVSTRQLKMCG